MLSSALTRLMMLEHAAGLGKSATGFSAYSSKPSPGQGASGIKPACGPDCTWTIVMATHEQLSGPRVSYDERGASGGGAGGKGASSSSSSNAASGGAPASASAGGVLSPGSNWIRVDPTDGEAALLAGTMYRPLPDAAGGQQPKPAGVRGSVIKSVRAGRLGLQIRLLTGAGAQAAMAAAGGHAQG